MQNKHALQVLQLPAVLRHVAGFASSEPGREAVRSLEPSAMRARVRDELERVDEMVRLLERSGDWAPPPIPAVRGALRKLRVEGSVWEGPALRDCGVLLASARTARAVIGQEGDRYPLLAALAEPLVSMKEEESAIGRVVDEAGDVRDDASRELAGIRRELRGMRGRIVQKLEEYMGGLSDRARVADASVTVRDGRFVVPVRRVARGEIDGVVHDESATGATLFVEPQVALQLMNRFRELEREEAREVLRILREATDRLRPHAAALLASLDVLIALDSLYARARYARRVDGHAPELLETGVREYEVVHGRHPLLLAAGEPVVPFDLRMEPGERTLIVSGPNTGGKTVLLKAIGLLSLMTQAGVIPPVGPGSRLPVFRDVFADIGDEQSIEASLSTFSAHLRNLREILDEADAESLVLIDEIGSGTDPSEGGALARSILLEVNGRETFTVATSHLGQLKLLAGEASGVVNASLQFDAEALAPTYRLVKGVPGRSYGLAIARRLGFPEAVLDRAEADVPEGERDVGQLLVELEQKERQTAEALEELESMRGEVVRLRDELEERRAAVERRETDAERRARQQARDLLLDARQEVESAIRDLRAAAGSGANEAAFEEAASVARRRVEAAARRQSERTPAPRRAAAPAPDVEEGATVRIAATGAVGTVVEIRDGRAFVETGGLRLDVPLDGLEAAEPEREARRDRGGWTGPSPDASHEVDLRGLRADEIRGRLLPALDAAHQADLRSLRIIHGKGTGALREVVAELLGDDARVTDFRAGRLGEGGTGVTVAELR